MSKVNIDAASAAAQIEAQAETIATSKTKFIPRIISVYTNKGGVGKTTAAYNIAAELARMGIRVGLIDCDSQCNSTKSFFKYQINFDRDFCPYTNAEHRRLIREELTSRIILGRSFDDKFEPQTGIHIRLTKQHTTEEIRALLEVTKDDGYRMALFLDENKQYHFAFLEQRSRKRPTFRQNVANREIDNVETDEITLQNITEIFTPDRWEAIKAGEADPTDRERRQLIFFGIDCTTGAKSKKHITYAVNEIMYGMNHFEVLTEPEEARKKDYREAYIIKGDDEEWTITHSKRAYPYTESNRIEETYDAPTLIDDYREKHARRAASGITTRDKKEIKERLCKIRASNIFTLLGEQTGSTREILLSTSRSASLIEAKPSQSETSHTDGVVMLLPGNRLFHLNLEEQASRAITDLTRVDKLTGESRPEIPREVGYITEARLKLTELARNNHLDFLILDLNPSISRINQLFITICDGILTPYNLEEYNDDAVEGFCLLMRNVYNGRRVLFDKLSSNHHKTLGINRDFKELKQVTPKFLGYFFQKYPKRLKRIDKDYIKNIEGKIRSKMIPQLIKQGMYPSNGIHGYDSGGTQHPEKKPLALREFVQGIGQWHKDGMPVAWITEKSKKKSIANQAKPVWCSIQNVISHTIGDYSVSNIHFTNPPVRELFKERGASMSIESTKTFLIESCKMAHSDWRLKCHQPTAIGNLDITHPLYRLDDIDMYLGLCVSIHTQLKDNNHKLGILCGRRDTPVLYLEKPCHFRRVNSQFQHSFRDEFNRLHHTIWDHTSQNLNILVTFFDNIEWHTTEFRVKPPEHVGLDSQLSVRINHTTAAPRQKLRREIKEMVVDLSNAICSIINEATGLEVTDIRKGDPAVVNCSRFYQNDLDSGILALLQAENFIRSAMSKSLTVMPSAPIKRGTRKRQPPIIRSSELHRKRHQFLAGIKDIIQDRSIGPQCLKNAIDLSESARKEQLHFSRFEENHIGEQLARCEDSCYIHLRKEWGDTPNPLHVAGLITLCAWHSSIPTKATHRSILMESLVRKGLAQIVKIERGQHSKPLATLHMASRVSILGRKKKARNRKPPIQKRAKKSAASI